LHGGSISRATHEITGSTATRVPTLIGQSAPLSTTTPPTS
jgi:hypothetical protein